MREPPLSDGELKLVRSMIDRYQDERAVGDYFAAGRRKIAFVVGLASGVAVVTASLLEIGKTLLS